MTNHIDDPDRPGEAGADLAGLGREAAPSPRAREDRGKPRETYHHGDLRIALVEEAREVLKTAPADALTLKGLALRLGVSQPAPYRHFQNREALLAAVAADGFRRFHEALTRAVAGDPSDRFGRGCRAYLEFAADNFGVYRLMFSGRLLSAATRQPDLAAASGTAFAALLSAVSGALPSARARDTAILLWSALHGMALLHSEGLLAGPGPRPEDGSGTGDLLMTRLVEEIGRRFAPPA